ncbi:hypothetical protein A6M21_09680 [Desulfotomaculum copahuensis]|uniref:Uncharacterized protein n=1 Tax=Desulfotomaculum copahuensis TaxID=1838280 RepID=A0A1B7LEF7_9FIRM|nr:hypothetical protein A6M21_09680 [Desulfotomaculum copahuensis]
MKTALFFWGKGNRRAGESLFERILNAREINYCPFFSVNSGGGKAFNEVSTWRINYWGLFTKSSRFRKDFSTTLKQMAAKIILENRKEGWIM